MIFECASNFVEDDSDDDSSSENEFVSGNTKSTTTSNRQKRKKKIDCVRNNNVDTVDVKCKEVKINNKSTNIIRNKTCNSTSNDSIEEIKMDKGFIIDKYSKDIHSINQCVPINNIITAYPVVQLTTCVMKDATSSHTTTTTVLISSAASAAAASSSHTVVNVTTTNNNNFTNDTKGNVSKENESTYSVFNQSDRLKDVISKVFEKDKLSLLDDLHTNTIATLSTTAAEPEANSNNCVKIKNTDVVEVEKENKLSTEQYDDGRPNDDFLGTLKIDNVKESISGKKPITTIVIDDDSNDFRSVGSADAEKDSLRSNYVPVLKTPPNVILGFGGSLASNSKRIENDFKQSPQLFNMFDYIKTKENDYSSSNSEKVVVSVLEKPDEKSELLLKEKKLTEENSIRQNNCPKIPSLQ